MLCFQNCHANGYGNLGEGNAIRQAKNEWIIWKTTRFVVINWEINPFSSFILFLCCFVSLKKWIFCTILVLKSCSKYKKKKRTNRIQTGLEKPYHNVCLRVQAMPCQRWKRCASQRNHAKRDRRRQRKISIPINEYYHCDMLARNWAALLAATTISLPFGLKCCHHTFFDSMQLASLCMTLVEIIFCHQNLLLKIDNVISARAASHHSATLGKYNIISGNRWLFVYTIKCESDGQI